MDDHAKAKCPAETYGADLVSEVMTRLYPSQEACAAGHGCERDDCAMDGHWPEETGSAGETNKPDPAQRCTCGRTGPNSSWEFLGSD